MSPSQIHDLVNSLRARSRSGLGFSRYWTGRTQLNEAFGRWIEEYNFRHEHAGLDKECAAGLYVPSLRKVRLEELEFFLVHEEPRRVLKTASITYYGQYCRVPDEYIGRRVWTRLKGEVYRVGEEGNRSISAQA